MSKDNGGPAFPAEIEEDGIPEFGVTGKFIVKTPGMTLRDYFAAKVIQGMAARDMYDEGQRSPVDRARLAYLEADAMLAERAK